MGPRQLSWLFLVSLVNVNASLCQPTEMSNQPLNRFDHLAKANKCLSGLPSCVVHPCGHTPHSTDMTTTRAVYPAMGSAEPSVKSNMVKPVDTDTMLRIFKSTAHWAVRPMVQLAGKQGKVLPGLIKKAAGSSESFTGKAISFKTLSLYNLLLTYRPFFRCRSHFSRFQKSFSVP